MPTLKKRPPVEEPCEDDEDASAPDPGSTGAMVLNQYPASVDGNHELVDVHLIAHPPYQRKVSDTWVKNNSGLGWNPALGYGIVVNRLPLKVHVERPDAEVDADAVAHAKQIRSKYIYEVIIGQHRAAMAKSLGISEIPALVIDHVDDDEAALLFVHDARTTRPLRGYDVHKAALTRHEPRAVMIQSALDARSIELVPSGLTDGKASCIRAFEKICGADVTQPDTQALDWCLDTLQIAFPTIKWPDPIVHGLLLWRRAEIRTGSQLPTPKALGAAIARRPNKGGGGGYGGDIKAFADDVRAEARTSGSPSPHVAAKIWNRQAQSLNKAATQRYADVDD